MGLTQGHRILRLFGMDQKSVSRRSMLSGAASIAALGALGSTSAQARNPSSKKADIKKGGVILFQGDSITDEGRKKDALEANDTKGLGRGYAADVAGTVMGDHPDLKLTFVPFQSEFDKAVKAAPANFWLWDGIHPSQPGHAFMAQVWRRAVGI